MSLLTNTVIMIFAVTSVSLLWEALRADSLYVCVCVCEKILSD